MEETGKAAGLRAELFRSDRSRWLSFFATEIGPNLARVHHLYYYADFDARDKVRAAVASDARWSDYLKNVKPFMLNQSSLIYVEATATLQGAGLEGAVPASEGAVTPAVAAATASSGVCYELRRYQLKLGYPTVPEFLKHYGEGLKDKLRVDQSAASNLVTLLYNEVGPLNSVIELWRHESMQRSQDSRAASRQAPLWKQAVVNLCAYGTPACRMRVPHAHAGLTPSYAAVLTCTKKSLPDRPACDERCRARLCLRLASCVPRASCRAAPACP